MKMPEIRRSPAGVCLVGQRTPAATTVCVTCLHVLSAIAGSTNSSWSVAPAPGSVRETQILISPEPDRVRVSACLSFAPHSLQNTASAATSSTDGLVIHRHASSPYQLRLSLLDPMAVNSSNLNSGRHTGLRTPPLDDEFPPAKLSLQYDGGWDIGERGDTIIIDSYL